MMETLALDLGSTTGWAVSPRESGTWDLRPRRGDSPGMRYILLRQRLQAVLDAHPSLKLVVYEQPHNRGGAATEYAYGCVATLQAWCAEKGIDHTGVHSATLKKAATGRGNAKKPEMIALAKSKWPDIRIVGDDHADALHLWQYAQDLGGA